MSCSNLLHHPLKPAPCDLQGEPLYDTGRGPLKNNEAEPSLSYPEIYIWINIQDALEGHKWDVIAQKLWGCQQ